MWDQILDEYKSPLIPGFYVYGNTQPVYYGVFDSKYTLSKFFLTTSFFLKKAIV